MNQLWLLVIIAAICCVVSCHEPDRLLQLKEHYKKFLEIVPPEYLKLKTLHPIITGTYQKGRLGATVNKGYEIYICLDGDLNSMFHVLLHELAHTTVPEYQHSKKFWSNFNELKEVAISHGLYHPINEYKPFCGKKIKD